jgi:hypothetical protein
LAIAQNPVVAIIKNYAMLGAGKTLLCGGGGKRAALVT